MTEDIKQANALRKQAEAEIYQALQKLRNELPESISVMSIKLIPSAHTAFGVVVSIDLEIRR